MSEFSIRQAHPDDVLDMMLVQKAGFPDEFQEPEEMFADIVGNATETCFIAEQDHTLIAYLLAHASEEGRNDYQGGFHRVIDTDVMFLHDLCVDPQIQSKGVGRALYDYFESQVKENGFSKIIGISVGDAALYWQKLGFTIKHSYPYNGEPGQYMVKEI
jgi:GNAT superfamily N-acetyltransferase